MTSARPADLATPGALDVLATRAFAQLGGLSDVTRVGLAVSEGGRRQLLFTATERLDATGAFEWCHIDASADVPLNVAAGRGELVAGDLDELARRFPAFVQGQRHQGVEHLAAETPDPRRHGPGRDAACDVRHARGAPCRRRRPTLPA